MGLVLKEILERRGMSQTDLVNQVNKIDDGITITKSFVSELVGGKSERAPSYLTMIKIAKVLGVSTDVLFGLVDDPDKFKHVKVDYMYRVDIKCICGERISVYYKSQEDAISVARSLIAGDLDPMDIEIVVELPEQELPFA